MIKYPKIPKGADLSRIHESLRDKACPIGMLTGHPDNPRLHPESNRKAINGSLSKYSQRKPIVANQTESGLRIEAGHGVYQEMLALGAQYVAVTIVEDSAIDELGYMLADNRSGDLSSDDPDKLAPIIRQLIEAGEDVEEIGWDDEAIKQLIGKVDDGDEDEKDSLYTQKIEAPIYKITGAKPEISELFDYGKSKGLIDEIDKSQLPDDVKSFLRQAAQRHVVFNYHNIAEYYAHASPELQKLMEDSALVIIDYNRAIELGYVKVSERLDHLRHEDYPDD